ncbi:MAG: hypothetical protein HQL95_15485, partial [Magnetococcales bacterium]|nr:hypothetical protein [Magnetococcales bacterium]
MPGFAGGGLGAAVEVATVEGVAEGKSGEGRSVVAGAACGLASGLVSVFFSGFVSGFLAAFLSPDAGWLAGRAGESLGSDAAVRRSRG